MDQMLAIRCFHRVVETRSFTSAGESINVPKATVSKLVKDLEAMLAVRLLQRTTRRVAVTDEGLAYYDATVRLLRELDEAGQALAGTHARPHGVLRVGMGGIPATSIVLPRLSEFLDRYPGIQVEFDISDRTIDLVAENVDCVVRGGTMADSSLISRRLGLASWVTCASPAYLRRHGLPQRPSDLRGHRLVLYREGAQGRHLPARFADGDQRIEVAHPWAVTVNDGRSQIAAALAGLGMVQTIEFAARDYIRRGELVPVLEAWRPPPYPLHVLFPAHRQAGSRARLFIDWLVDVFDEFDQTA